jgi:dihydroceramidase
VYAAEIVNTLTNSLFVWLAYKGLVSCYKHGHDRVFGVAYAGYFAVGVGSLLFHATLKCTLEYSEVSLIPTDLSRSYAACR